jgi:inorganic pyrophosphatase
MDYSKLKIGPNAPEIIYALTEIPQGSSNKYEFDLELETIRLDRVLHTSMYYPGDYGLVPETLSADGDPADILVIISKPTFPGCVLRVRPIGLLKMEDSGFNDYKILAVAEDDPVQKGIKTYKDLSPSILKQIEHFFESYKLLENKITKVLGWEDEKSAQAYILKVHQDYLKKNNKGR